MVYATIQPILDLALALPNKRLGPNIMRVFIRLITAFTFLLLLLGLFCSCADRATTAQGLSQAEQAAGVDTLAFSSGIRAIFEDSKGRLWFGSLQEGVAVYDGISFTYYSAQDGLADNQIHHIQEDRKGVIWFTTQEGVSSYDGTRITNHSRAAEAKTQPQFPMPQQVLPDGGWAKLGGDLWFGAGNQEGVYRYDGQKLMYLAFPAPKIAHATENLFALTSMSKGKANRIWFGTYAGVFGYDGKSFTIITDESLGFDRKVAPLHIRSILEDTKGRLWIGNNGIGVLLSAGDSIINFSKRNGLIHPSSGRRGGKSMTGTLEHVFTIAEDGEENLWFGDRDAGIWKFDGTKLTNYTQKDGLANDFALSIYEDKKGVLWFGMADGRIYTFKDGRFEKRL